MKNVELFDTTLRDGMQGVGINFTLGDKIKIVHKLDEMKIDFIEGGFPLSNKKEASFFSQIKKEKLQHAKIVAFGSTRKPGAKADEDQHIQALIKTEVEHIILVGKTWKEHVEKVLGTDINENLEIIEDSITYLRKKGHKILFDLEHFFDGFKDDSQYALKVLETASKAGAQTLVLCDTNGGTLPSEVIQIMQQIPQDALAPLGVHFHNDCGTAVANSLIALDYGAVHIQGTINGWGERCGNANLCTIVPSIALKTQYKTNMSAELKKITSLSRYVYEIANIIPEKIQPYVGEAAFCHKAGQHADVINKAPHLMEHINSDLVGNSRDILLSELAGKSTILSKLTKYGSFDKKSKEVQELTEVLKKKEEEGYEYETATASFDILIRKAIKQYKPIIELNNYHLESFKTGAMPSKTVGRIFVTSDNKNMMGAAVSIGPVDTLDKSLRDALTPHYPFLKKINLIDYKVRILDPESAAGAKVRVFITSTDQKREWGTVGVSENIVEASWEALMDSYDYYYNNIVLTVLTKN
ncbi:MAG: citramalate synthase [Spirochaetes bacterium]|nr:citramalate synthase [Spirochaetota bacterium]